MLIEALVTMAAVTAKCQCGTLNQRQPTVVIVGMIDCAITRIVLRASVVTREVRAFNLLASGYRPCGPEDGSISG